MNSKKKLLLITYYWPPAGGAGVQRWLKMIKYLSSSFQVTVYSPINAQYPILDESLLTEVPSDVKLLSYPIIEPYGIANLLSRKNKNLQKGNIPDQNKQSVFTKLSLWVRANLFIPDARVLWVKPSIKFLSKHIQTNSYDYMVTTGPPHSMHLIGLGLKKKFNKIKWLADFRDPWTDIDYFKDLPFTNNSLKKQHQLEREVLQTCDIATTVSPTWAKDLSKIRNRKVTVVYNGFDADDFTIQKQKEGFQFTYIGSLNSDRNVPELWKELNSIIKNNPKLADDFQLNFAGNIDQSVRNQIEALPLLCARTKFLGYLDHKDAVKLIMNSSILLLLINDSPNQKGIIPGKFFEYLATDNQILTIGKYGSDIEELLKITQAGMLLEKENLNPLESFICNEYLNKGVKHITTSDVNANYTRESAAKSVQKLLLSP